MSHTPGPWIYAPDFDKEGNRAKVTAVAHCCEFVIGLPSVYDGGNYRDGDPSGDPEADARLIAAAPEMLEVLQALRGAVAGHQFTRMDVEAIRAAIAKALGDDG